MTISESAETSALPPDKSEPSKAANHPAACPARPAELLLRLGQFVADKLAEPGLVRRSDELLNSLEIARQLLDEGVQLLAKQRHDAG